MSSFRVGHVQGWIFFFFGADFGRVQVFSLRPFSKKYGFLSCCTIVTSASTPFAWCVCSPQITIVRSALLMRSRTSFFQFSSIRYFTDQSCNAEWRFSFLGLGDQIAPKVVICGHSQS